MASIKGAKLEAAVNGGLQRLLGQDQTKAEGHDRSWTTEAVNWRAQKMVGRGGQQQ